MTRRNATKTDWLVIAFLIVAAGTNVASIFHTLLH